MRAMAAVDFSAHAVNPTAGPASAMASAASAPDEGGATFDDLLDIVNPLQHIPIVSTIYRAITGDHIKTFPKIAGDMLYGGVTGFLGSLADSIFEKITGKSVGDTMLAFAENLFSPSSSSAPATGVADAATAPTTVALHAPASLQGPAVVTPAALQGIAVPGQDALLAALTRKGTDPALAQRAADAYRRSVNVAGQAAATALH
jgi:hypothetical protein